MKRAIFDGKDIVIEETTIPRQSENEVVVKVKKCAICGSDLLKRKSTNPIIEWGHEIIGIECETNKIVTIRTSFPCAKCDYCEKGQSELCTNWKRTVFSGFGEFIVVNKKCLIPLPNDDDIYILVEPLNVAIEMINQLDIENNNKLAIIGNAAIALMCALYAKKTYNVDVSVFSRNDSNVRSEFCKTNGILCYSVNDMKLKLKDFKKVICTAPYEVIGDIVDYSSPHTKIVFNGISNNSVNNLDLSKIHFKNLTLCGLFAHPQNDFSNSIQFISNTADIIRTLITKEYALEHIKDAFDFTLDSSKEYIKVVINMEK